MGSQLVEPNQDQLYVKTLGQFSVIKEGRSLEQTAWVREKARILFQYFITNRRQSTPRERITYELWPNLDPARANRDFKVALNAINKALQGNRQDKKNIGYIHRQGLSYRLNPSTSITVDADIFETKLKEGRRIEKNNPQSSIDHYREGLKVYGGEFLPDRLYDDWTSGERERLTSLFLLGSTSLASLLLTIDEPDEAIIWSKQVTAVDPLWEEAYRIQMRAFISKGNRPQVIRIYDHCREILEEHLDIEPMAETTAIYKQILGK